MLLTGEELKKELATVSSWVIEDGQLVKNLSFKDFKEALKFVNEVGELSEKADHHPVINIEYNKVGLSLSTHSERGITDKDFNLALKIDQIPKI